MSHIVYINLDETAAMVRENLDLALPHVTNQAHVNPVSALKTVTAQWSYCDLILRNLNSKYTLEVERFTAQVREARSLINQFWSVYQIFPIERANGHVVQAQVVEQNHKHVIHVKHKQRVNLSNSQRAEIRDYVKAHRPLHEDDYQLLMAQFGISRGGINHYQYETR